MNSCNDYIVQLGGNIRCGVEHDADLVGEDVVVPIQTHSCNVEVMEKTGEFLNLEDTDALICLRKGIKIGIRTADCVPVLLYAPDIDAVAAIHAGWKGTLGGIVERVVEKLIDMGSDPVSMKVAFGPSICGECYEVSEDLAGKFIDAGFEEALVNQRHVSLEMANTLQLLRKGLLPDNIFPGVCCTKESSVLPSWRRCPSSKRMLTWVEMK